MSVSNGWAGRINAGVGLVLLTLATGCLGYMDAGYGGPVVVVPGPDALFFDTYYEGGRATHDYSHRGYASHGSAHPVMATRPAVGRESRRR